MTRGCRAPGGRVVSVAGRLRINGGQDLCIYRRVFKEMGGLGSMRRGAAILDAFFARASARLLRASPRLLPLLRCLLGRARCVEGAGSRLPRGAC
jgi:hypothetical protein